MVEKINFANPDNFNARDASLFLRGTTDVKTLVVVLVAPTGMDYAPGSYIHILFAGVLHGLTQMYVDGNLLSQLLFAILLKFCRVEHLRLQLSLDAVGCEFKVCLCKIINTRKASIWTDLSLRHNQTIMRYTDKIKSKLLYKYNNTKNSGIINVVIIL